jgi:ParB-like chromosome segregation protein Spo0J
MKDIKLILRKHLRNLDDDAKIEYINDIKSLLHNLSPFRDEPVDCVLWVKSKMVFANDYNPNNVAPPEMELLKISILSDGYTQPIVTFDEHDKYTVVDGFHRNRVGTEIEEVKKRVRGYLPITIIRESQQDKGDRIASTIRHNRARGKHQIQGMSNIVLELKRRNWSDNKIAKNLGMDADEILRLTQIGGLKDMFKDDDFSLAWEVSETTTENDIDNGELQQ